MEHLQNRTTDRYVPRELIKGRYVPGSISADRNCFDLAERRDDLRDERASDADRLIPAAWRRMR